MVQMLLAGTHRRSARRRPNAADVAAEEIVDAFAGAGGASLGIEKALGRPPDIAVNHDAKMIAAHAINHPATKHLTQDVFELNIRRATAGRRVGLAWFSPDCCHFSRAKGGKPVKKHIRALAWVVCKWAAQVKPRVIILENVREFQDWGPLTDKNLPCPERKGLTFRRFVGRLRNSGYAVEWRSLNAADYGAPTHRRRLFLVARCDGAPITWPAPTHGPGRPRPYRTAAECIDWSLPCASIFLTREQGRRFGVNRPLADKTMRRIAMGLKRYVLDNPKPFIVRCDHGGEHFRGQPLDAPLATLTEHHGFGLVSPYITRIGQYGSNGHCVAKPDGPLTTIVSKNEHCLIAPFLAQRYGEAPHQDTRGQRTDEPLRTITPGNHSGVLVSPILAAHLSQYNSEKTPGEVRAQHLDSPLNTVVSQNRFGLTVANLIELNHGNKQAFAADEPLRTVRAQGLNHALVATDLSPMIADRHELVRGFLLKYYGKSVGQRADEPLHTVTGKARFGVVAIGGTEYCIADIGLRMLTPRELARAQGFPDDYVLIGSKASQVAGIGNSVSPMVATALVRANCMDLAVKQAA